MFWFLRFLTVIYFKYCMKKVITIYFDVFSDFGKNPTLLNFLGKHVNIRKAEGSLISTSISPYPAILHSYINRSKWDDAVRLCRFVHVSLHFIPSF